MRKFRKNEDASGFIFLKLVDVIPVFHVNIHIQQKSPSEATLLKICEKRSFHRQVFSRSKIES